MKKVIILLSALLMSSVLKAEIKPRLSLVENFCGVNVLESMSPVWVNEVCISHITGTKNEVMTIQYTNGATEFLPIILREEIPNTMENSNIVQRVVAYTQGAKMSGGYLFLNTLEFTLVRDLNGGFGNGGTLTGSGSWGMGFQVPLQMMYVTRAQ